MPRLVGRQSNSGLSVVLLLLLAVGFVGMLEYFGVTNFLPSNINRNNRIERIQ